jgi:hypothetical protein
MRPNPQARLEGEVQEKLAHLDQLHELLRAFSRCAPP